MSKRMKKKQTKNEVTTVDAGLCMLMLMCQKGGLNFSTQYGIGGVYVRDPEVNKEVSTGYIKDWPRSTPVQQLNKMIKEVQEYTQKNRP